MADNVLAVNSSPNLRVYVVWFHVLWFDSRSEWDPQLLADSRVRQYWDNRRIAGDWFGHNVDRGDSFAWDAYYVFGPRARWREIPAPLLARGSPVIRHVDALQRALILSGRT